MPGAPATAPRTAAPRYANTDGVDFAGQVNAVTDAFDAKVALLDGVTAAAGRILGNRLVAADAQPAFYARGDGAMFWGPGGAVAPDVNLYRSLADRLGTDDLFHAAQLYTQLGLANQIVLAGDGKIYFGSAADTNLYRSAVDYLQTDDSFRTARELRVNWDFVVAENNTGRVYFGSALDTNLYRSAADVLKTDDQFHTAGDVIVRPGGTDAGQVLVGAQGPAAQAGLRFGTTGDTNLYRLQANALKTSGQFFAGGAAGFYDGDDARYVQIGRSDFAVPTIQFGTGAAILFASSGLENLRIIRGAVSAGGAILNGSGFSVVKNAGLGSYTVTFSNAFPSGPTVAVSSFSSEGIGVAMEVRAVGSFRAKTFFTNTAALQDSGFDFIAVGPR